MAELVTKKKKKIDFELLRKLEKDYDEAVEDMENKEELLIKSVHQEYLKAENKGEFFEKLKHSDVWYYDKFREHDPPLELSRPDISSSRTRETAERKIDDLVSSIDDETLIEEIRSKPPVEIVKTVNFGKYQETVSKIRRMRLISEHDFNVDPSYKLVLLKELDETIDFLTELRKKVEVAEHERT